ncbi:MAG: hypothetical protein K2O71_00255, partial [Lachnospiraceae bacterium]|nr:hypothetical protein [Lachnospiraceae bacterium]
IDAISDALRSILGGSYASNIERKASDMASMTEQLAKNASSSKTNYNRNGNYSSFATGGIYDGFF